MAPHMLARASQFQPHPYNNAYQFKYHERARNLQKYGDSIGKGAGIDEPLGFQIYDQAHHAHASFTNSNIAKLKKKFGGLLQDVAK